MSYDLYLEVDTGGPEPVEVWWRNYTSNVAGMWRRAMPNTDGLAGLDMLPATEALRHLDRGLSYMDERKAELEALNPPSGWGDYEGARETVAEMLNACREHPETRVRVSR